MDKINVEKSTNKFLAHKTVELASFY
jgi:hypothetical protein